MIDNIIVMIPFSHLFVCFVFQNSIQTLIIVETI